MSGEYDRELRQIEQLLGHLTMQPENRRKRKVSKRKKIERLKRKIRILKLELQRINALEVADIVRIRNMNSVEAVINAGNGVSNNNSGGLVTQDGDVEML